MDREAMARWLLAFIEAHENGDLPETDLIVLDSIHTHLASPVSDGSTTAKGGES